MNAADEQEEYVDQTPKKEKKTKKKKTNKTKNKTQKTETELKVTTNTETETKPYSIYATPALVFAAVMLVMVFAPP